MESSQRKIGIILSYIVIFINIFVSLVFTPIITSKLGQSEYGLYSLVSSIISYLTIMDFGFGNAIIIYSSRYRAKNEKEKENKLYGMFLKVYMIIGIICSIIGLIVYFNINNLFGSSMVESELQTAKTLMVILTINLSLSFPLSVFASIVNSYERFVFAKIVNIISIILRQALILLMLYFGYKSIAMSLVITIVNILNSLFNYIYCKNKLGLKIIFGKIDYKLLIEIFGFSFWIFLNNIVDKVNWNLDNFILGSICGTIAVSIYSIASQFNQLYIIFSTAISGVLLPKITKMIDCGASDTELTDLLIKTGRIQLMIVGLILGGFIVFGKYFVLLWLGKKYVDSYYIAIALMAPLICSLTQNSCTSIAQAKNKHKFMPIVEIIGSILNVIISIPLVKKFSGLGAALGTAISLIICNIIIKNIYYYKSLKIDVLKFFRKLANIFILLATETISFMFIINKFNIIINSWLSLILYIVLFTVIYALFLLLCLNDYEKGLIKSVLKRKKV